MNWIWNARESCYKTEIARKSLIHKNKEIARNLVNDSITKALNRGERSTLVYLGELDSPGVRETIIDELKELGYKVEVEVKKCVNLYGPIDIIHLNISW